MIFKENELLLDVFKTKYRGFALHVRHNHDPLINALRLSPDLNFGMSRHEYLMIGLCASSVAVCLFVITFIYYRKQYMIKVRR